jgi:hypothetical protein
MNAKLADRETVTFDCGIPAELFMGKRKGGPRQPLRYRRLQPQRRRSGSSRPAWDATSASDNETHCASLHAIAGV